MNQFGGSWTEMKLKALGRYLAAYRTIFDKNPRARFFKTIYIDGFAGSGEWERKNSESSVDESEFSLFESTEKEDACVFAKGSVQIALELDSPFDEYIFIELNAKKAVALEKKIADEFPHLLERVTIKVGDCNFEMKKIINQYDWKKYRAVCFLDPYGMSIEWNTIADIAATNAMDMWLLFPLGIGVCRLLMKKEIPKGAWAERLTTVLGTDKWKHAFYSKNKRQTLFGDVEEIRRTAGVEEIGEFFIERLRSTFPGVADTPLILKNSRNNPLYLLCFAVGNDRAVGPALRISGDIIGKA